MSRMILGIKTCFKIVQITIVLVPIIVKNFRITNGLVRGNTYPLYPKSYASSNLSSFVYIYENKINIFWQYLLLSIKLNKQKQKQNKVYVNSVDNWTVYTRGRNLYQDSISWLLCIEKRYRRAFQKVPFWRVISRIPISGANKDY